MNVSFNPVMTNKNTMNFGKKGNKNPFGPIDKHLSRDESIIKRTKEAIFQEAALGVAATCLLYFRIEKNILRHQVNKKAVKQYERIRVGQPPVRPLPLEKYFSKKKLKQEIEKQKNKAQEQAQKQAQKQAVVKDFGLSLIF